MNNFTPKLEKVRSLREVIEAQMGAPLPNDDVVMLALPLFTQATVLHHAGLVCGLDSGAVVLDSNGGLALQNAMGQAPVDQLASVHRVQPGLHSHLNIIGEIKRTTSNIGTVEERADVQIDAQAPISRPVYLPGPLSWEQCLGHHDEMTDIFMLGMILASLSCGLDFSEVDDLRRFVACRENLFILNESLHPVIAQLIVEMTELNRHDRATDLENLRKRLRDWREQASDSTVQSALAGVQGIQNRRTAVLSHLRDRLFDLSKRNRLLYFKPTTSTVNLTIASVPLVLQIERIKVEDLCTWNQRFATEVLSGKTLALQNYLRFDDQVYLPASLDQLIADVRRDRNEYGFSNLRLVVAFLRWHNLKENPDERINSPLLWLPVELTKRKGVRDQYQLQCSSAEAEFNPVLRHQLNQLYGIQLPEKIDLDKHSLEQIHADIEAQIQLTEKSVALRLIQKPSIRLVHQKAQQRLQQFRRARPRYINKTERSGVLPSFSYAREDYRPLGRALFEQWIRNRPLPQRFDAGASPAPRPLHMVAAVNEEPLGYTLEEQEGHRYAWDLDLTQVSLANFNYRKMSLVRDYAQLLDVPANNPAFDRVFSIQPRDIETTPPAALAFADQWNVASSDATQNAAISIARDQRSFIIQGPPGTGKSQTITNLIADYLGRGKRVLFVCEKRAALDVVFYRLKQSGLDSLCSLIHDSQADKKTFIADLKKCYEGWIANDDQSLELANKRQQLVAEMQAYRDLLEDFENAMAQSDTAVGMSARTLLRRLVSLPTAPQITTAENESLPKLKAWDLNIELVERVYRAMRERFGVGSLAAHPFAHLKQALVQSDNAHTQLEKMCVSAEALLDQIEPSLESQAGVVKNEQALQAAIRGATHCKHLIETNLIAHLDLLQVGSPSHVDLQELLKKFSVEQASLYDAESANTFWSEKFSFVDTESALALSMRLEASFLRWLQPAWWNLRKQMNARYGFSKHAIRPDYVTVLKNLLTEHRQRAHLSNFEQAQAQRFGVPSFSNFLEVYREAQKGAVDDAQFLKVIEYLRSRDDASELAADGARLLPSLERLREAICPHLLDAEAGCISSLAELVRDLRESLDELPELLPVLRSVHAMDRESIWVMQKLNYTPAQLSALVVNQAWVVLQRENPVLARFNGASLAQVVRTLSQQQKKSLQQNAELILAKAHGHFLDHVRTSNLSATQLDQAGKELKKTYSTGRRELEHEFGKTMRHRSIRDLADEETGLVIRDLKPVWLMSPLSVSDTLPLQNDLFDVVIFDEASQIPTEEAVPALSRAQQIIVVGDEMQLPPTKFFGATSNEEEDLIVEEDGEQYAISLDSDSLLNQAARNLNATMLAWHYRSRHEALISFSNAAFYDGRLVTVPERVVRAANEELFVCCAEEEFVAMGVDHLLSRPISFHKLRDGVYVERRNEPEARYIALLVRELLQQETGQSIGIVAFSEAQQSAIESALTALGAEDPGFAAVIENEYARIDDDQFNGLFVKNLENVQGDERDIIILSICYAPGRDGKMLMNFGPINQRGGEKRLNVIFSRARFRMAVVSTIEADAITNIHNDGASALRNFLQFAKASATGQGVQAQSILGALTHGARRTFARDVPADAIRDELCSALQERGYCVDMHVGTSQFRCDLAIMDSEKKGYALAILLDNTHRQDSDVVERYVFQPEILRHFGWQVVDILSKDWLNDRNAVLHRIETILTQNEDPALYLEMGPLVDVKNPTLITSRIGEESLAGNAPTQVTKASEALDESPAGNDAQSEQRYLCFEQGVSSKFWQVTLKECELSICYGRLGNKGQSLTKQFDTPERARREMEKLVAEKLRKGYTDKSLS